MIQIALTLWLAALQLQLQVANMPNVEPELRTQVQIVTTQAITYAQGIIKNPPVETKPIVEAPQPTPVYVTVVAPEPQKTVEPVAPVVVPLEFTVIPTITATTTMNGIVRTFHFETNMPATATFYVGQSPRDIGYSTTTSTSFNFSYAFQFDYYKIEVKAGGQTKTYQDRCDGSLTCFNPSRTGPKEYTIN